MDNPDDAKKVGRGHPPAAFQWKKGQCGNPKRIRRRTRPTMKKIVDDFFASEIWVTENGVRRRCSNFEAIVAQLCNKADAGNRLAMRALLKYMDFARERGGSQEINFVLKNNDGTYTPLPPISKDDSHG